MILGIGVDMVEVVRIRRALENPRTGGRFQARVFTEEEAAYCARRRNGHESFAARFAAKEAAMKALGCGLGQGIGWRDIEITRGDGAPTLRLLGAAQRLADGMGVRRMHVSLTHTAEFAVAYVIAES